MNNTLQPGGPRGQQRGPITFHRPSILRRPGRVVSAYIPGRYQPGTKVRFKSGSTYVVGPAGNLLRVQP